jgi:hypothetical protein
MRRLGPFSLMPPSKLPPQYQKEKEKKEKRKETYQWLRDVTVSRLEAPAAAIVAVAGADSVVMVHRHSSPISK